MEKTKIGIIGLGVIAQLAHLPFLKKQADVEVTAIADINSNTLKTVAKKFKVNNTFTDHEKLLSESGVDAVIIATPTRSHKNIALDVIRHKKHLLIEKPIARTLKEARTIVDESKKAGVLAMAGMNMRYRPDIMLLKSIVSSGEIGSIFNINCGFMKPKHSVGSWRKEKAQAGGGVIFDLGIGLLDLALWFTDFPKPLSVSTQNYHYSTESVEDYSVSFIRLSPDVVITLEAGWTLVSEEESFSFALHGTNGDAFINPLRIYKKVDQQNVVDLTPAPGRETTRNIAMKSYENQLRHFIGAVKGFNALTSPADDALTRMAIIDQMYKSSDLKKEIGV